MSQATILRGLLVPFAALLLAPAGQAEDWPQWRGADRLGVWRETGIVERFPEAGLQVRWRTPISGGYAGPAVASGRVYVLDWQPDETSRHLAGAERLVALSEETGEVLFIRGWDASYASLMASYATGPRATPTVDGDRVYVQGSVGHLLAVHAATGEVVFQHDFVKEYGSEIPTWGTSSAPLVEGDLVIAIAGAEPDGKVIAYDKRTGQEVWRALSSDWEMGYCQPVVLEAGGVRQLIVWHPKAVSSLDPRTGKIYWEVEWDVGMGMTVATPVYDSSRLFLTQFYRGSLMLELASESPGVREVWRRAGTSEMPEQTEALHSLITTPILEADAIYGVDSYGELRALDAQSGERLWVDRTLTRQGRWGSAFMVRNGDRYFINTDTGDLVIGRFTRAGFVEIDRTRLIEPITSAGFGPRRLADAAVNWSHPAYANGHVVARNDREILRASLRQAHE